MVRVSLLLSTVVSLSLAAQSLDAQTMRLATPQPISVTRSGIVAGNTYEPMVASNGSSFLMAWADDRISVHSLGSGNQVYGSSLLMRIDAEGTPLDEFPIAIPLLPLGIVWNGSEWIVAGSGTLARISAEGTILEVRPIGEPNFTARGVAWAGNALVLTGVIRKRPSDFEGTGGLRALTLDADLDVVANVVLTDIASEIVATVGDGQSALTLWRDGPGVSEGWAYHGASFGPDGLHQQTRKNLITNLVVGHPYIRTLSAGATGKGYVVVYQSPSVTGFVYKAAWVERDLDTRAISLAPHKLNGSARSLAWDGTSLTLYTTDIDTDSNDPNPELYLMAIRFSAEGFLSSTPRNLGVMSPFPALAAAGIAGKTILASTGFEADHELKFRVLVPPSFPDSPERSVSGPGPRPQDFAAAASKPAQSLVVWRERTSPSQWGIYATRLGADATVLDPESLPLAASSCDAIRPAVATDGEHYLAAWHDQNGIATAAVRSDGTFTKRPSIGRRTGGCAETPLALLSNGTDYLLLWLEKAPASEDVWDLFGLRLRPDGSIIDTQAIAVGKMNASHPSVLRIEAASNGQDYMIAWEGAAVRLSSEGALLDPVQKIRLGKGFVLGLWWNGTTYIAQTTSDDGFRFLRIGSDGSGGRPPTGPQVDPVPFPPGSGGFYFGQRTCDPSGCWVGGTVRHADGHDTLAALRYEDDGTRFTMRRQDVENVSFTSVCDLTPFPATMVNAGRPAFLFLPQRMEQPFSSVHRLMIAPLAVPRGRAARHP